MLEKDTQLFLLSIMKADVKILTKIVNLQSFISIGLHFFWQRNFFSSLF